MSRPRTRLGFGMDFSPSLTPKQQNPLPSSTLETTSPIHSHEQGGNIEDSSYPSIPPGMRRKTPSTVQNTSINILPNRLPQQSQPSLNQHDQSKMNRQVEKTGSNDSAMNPLFAYSSDEELEEELDQKKEEKVEKNEKEDEKEKEKGQPEGEFSQKIKEQISPIALPIQNDLPQTKGQTSGEISGGKSIHTVTTEGSEIKSIASSRDENIGNSFEPVLLGDNWFRTVDPTSKKVYYYNSQTKVSQWIVPTHLRQAEMKLQKLLPSDSVASSTVSRKFSQPFRTYLAPPPFIQSKTFESIVSEDNPQEDIKDLQELYTLVTTYLSSLKALSRRLKSLPYTSIIKQYITVATATSSSTTLKNESAHYSSSDISKVQYHIPLDFIFQKLEGIFSAEATLQLPPLDFSYLQPAQSVESSGPIFPICDLQCHFHTPLHQWLHELYSLFSLSTTILLQQVQIHAQTQAHGRMNIEVNGEANEGAQVETNGETHRRIRALQNPSLLAPILRTIVPNFCSLESTFDRVIDQTIRILEKEEKKLTQLREYNPKTKDPIEPSKEDIVIPMSAYHYQTPTMAVTNSVASAVSSTNLLTTTTTTMNTDVDRATALANMYASLSLDDVTTARPTYNPAQAESQTFSQIHQNQGQFNGTHIRANHQEQEVGIKIATTSNTTIPVEPQGHPQIQQQSKEASPQVSVAKASTAFIHPSRAHLITSSQTPQQLQQQPQHSLQASEAPFQEKESVKRAKRPTQASILAEKWKKARLVEHEQNDEGIPRIRSDSISFASQTSPIEHIQPSYPPVKVPRGALEFQSIQSPAEHPEQPFIEAQTSSSSLNGPIEEHDWRSRLLRRRGSNEDDDE